IVGGGPQLSREIRRLRAGVRVLRHRFPRLDEETQLSPDTGDMSSRTRRYGAVGELLDEQARDEVEEACDQEGAESDAEEQRGEYQADHENRAHPRCLRDRVRLCRNPQERCRCLAGRKMASTHRHVKRTSMKESSGCEEP